MANDAGFLLGVLFAPKYHEQTLPKSSSINYYGQRREFRKTTAILFKLYSQQLSLENQLSMLGIQAFY